MKAARTNNLWLSSYASVGASRRVWPKRLLMRMGIDTSISMIKIYPENGYQRHDVPLISVFGKSILRPPLASYVRQPQRGGRPPAAPPIFARAGEADKDGGQVGQQVPQPAARPVDG